MDRTGALATMTMAEFANFLSNADQVESKGETKIDGKTAEHFQGKVNAREVAEKTGGETAKRFREQVGNRDVLHPDGGLDRRRRAAGPALDAVRGRRATRCRSRRRSSSTASPVDVQPPPTAETMEKDEFDALTGG